MIETLGSLAAAAGHELAVKADDALNPQRWDTARGWTELGSASSSGVAVTPDVAMALATVYACVRIIAESIAMLPLHMLIDDGERSKRKDKTHPLYDVLRRRPNARQTSFEFRELLMIDALTRGNGYAHIRMNRNGVVQELWPMRAATVHVMEDEDETLWYRWTKPNGQQLLLPQQEVFHLRGLGDGPVGKAPLTSYRESVGSALAAQEFSAAMFRNGLTVGGFVKAPEKMTAEGKSNLLRFLENRHAGFQRAFKVGVLDAGSEWVNTTIPPKDVQLLELRRFLREEIASIFRVPPHMIGALERATNNNIEQQAREFMDYTLGPWLVRFEQAAERDLLSARERGPRSIKHNVGAILRGAFDARAKFYAAGRQWGWFSVNDIRELEDLNAVEGGDRYLEPVNMVEAGSQPDPNPADQAA